MDKILTTFLHTKNTYYSGVAGAIAGLAGGDIRLSALISASIAGIDVSAFPHERPAHITPGKWVVGNLLTSTAAGLAAYGVGYGARKIFSSYVDRRAIESECWRERVANNNEVSNDKIRCA